MVWKKSLPLSWGRRYGRGTVGGPRLVTCAHLHLDFIQGLWQKTQISHLSEYNRTGQTHNSKRVAREYQGRWIGIHLGRYVLINAREQSHSKVNWVIMCHLESSPGSQYLGFTYRWLKCLGKMLIFQSTGIILWQPDTTGYFGIQ